MLANHMLLAMSNAALPEKNVRLKVKYDKKALNRARQQREKKLIKIIIKIIVRIINIHT